ncbi:hypothetical protein SARC_06568 [Sphaeroforma arctica JP610]|uniref:Agd3 deacetylase domain-containing protein n=1 Tax=Sphaeroforma arctica JP610 TaxID=667725 RepID=A0A0L0FYS0_9EUKA|nr:hypothetical protein SARC_06568 [Sphaeroforma arctica JP610]KNC81088.1 hypothetical protein SARC_06568 [Sphaeroforma arctica JP610]|eukprot:XP_014154990.1 hypothetical protein SARC_06568 [Sphaeroforma arctica JP610]
MHKSIVLTLGLLSPVLAQTQTDFTIGAKTLILSAGTNTTEELPKWVLDSYGVDYDIKELTTGSTITIPACSEQFNHTECGQQKTNYTLNTLFSLELMDSNTDQPKYNSIILTSAVLGYFYYSPEDFSKTFQQRGLSAELEEEIDTYCTDYGVRTVSMRTDPIDIADEGLQSALNGAGVSHQGTATLKFVPGELSASMHNILKEHATFKIGGEISLSPTEAYWLTPARIEHTANTDRHIEPLMEVDYTCPDGSACKSVGVSLITHPTTKRETLHFHFNSDKNGLHGFTFGHMWFPWVTRGLFLGHRQIILQADIDDYYLDTGVYNTTLNRQAKGGETTPPMTYRITGEDLEHHKTFQQRINHQFGTGSNFTIQMAFNGRGEGEFGKVEAYAPNLNQASFDLFDDFLWVTHTWNHIDMYCLYSNCTEDTQELAAQEFDSCFDWTSQTCDYGVKDEPIYLKSGYTPYEYNMYELTRNQHFAETVLNVSDHSKVWSPKSIVTPRISGLNYTESIRAMLAAGIRNAVGDNSRKDLRQANAWQPFDAVVKMGKDGVELTDTSREAFEAEMISLYGVKSINVIPRFATRVYFDVSTPTEMAMEHNSIYGPNCKTCDASFQYQHDLSFQEIIDLEGFEVARNMLSLRTDPYMFHQANLRVNDMGSGKTASLLEAWIESSLKWVSEYTTFSLQSYKMDALAEVYRLRKERDDCDITGKIHYAKGKPVKLTVSSQNACQAKLTYTQTAGSGDYKPLVRTLAGNVRRQAVSGGSTENVDTTIDVDMGGSANNGVDQEIDLEGSGIETPSPVPTPAASVTPTVSPSMTAFPTLISSPVATPSTSPTTTPTSSGQPALAVSPAPTVAPSVTRTSAPTQTDDTATATATATATSTSTETETQASTVGSNPESTSGETATGTDLPKTDGAQSNSGLSTLAMIGIGAGAAVLILVVLVLGICLCRRDARAEGKLLASA